MDKQLLDVMSSYRCGKDGWFSRAFPAKTESPSMLYVLVSTQFWTQKPLRTFAGIALASAHYGTNTVKFRAVAIPGKVGSGSWNCVKTKIRASPRFREKRKRSSYPRRPSAGKFSSSQ
jgi:hypothetical protein